MNERLIRLLKIETPSEVAQLGQPRGASAEGALQFAPLASATGGYKHILAYVHSLEEMQTALQTIHEQGALQEGGLIHLIYPKLRNSSGLVGIHRDDIFPYLQVDDEGYPEGLPYKFNRMLSADECYTLIGLKYVPRKAQASRSRASERVGDYEHLVPTLAEALAEEVKPIFAGLTPGYQRGWARYLYSAKQEATQKSRLERMMALLLAGVKSIDQAPKAKG